MARCIWKFPLALCGRTDLTMPVGAEIVRVDTQGVIPTLWAIVNPEAESEVRTFAVVVTGQTYDERESRFVGTFIQSLFVWHVIERIVPPSLPGEAHGG